ncbi:MAG: ABC transporter ATP-binding protein, partial [Clostridia bacterium]|nr:ABC transporter ATP-binding protein [Clostridia bacterium]
MTKNKNKLSIFTYFKKHKFVVSLYIIINIFAAASTVGVTLTMAQAVAFLTDAVYRSAIIYFLISFAFSLGQRIFWFVSDILYDKYSVVIMSEINLDLSKQAFKLNSETYSNHDSGTFIQRIVHDPKEIIDNLSDIIIMITEIISGFVMLVYIATLNWIIGIIIFTTIIVCVAWEMLRVKVRAVNTKEEKKKSEKINSLTTQIVASEKDIKSISLEDKLSEVSKSYYEEYKKASIKRNVTEALFFNARNLMIEIAGVISMVIGVILVEKSMIVLSSFIIVYSFHGQLYGIIWQLGNVWSKISSIKINNDRMFMLFDEHFFVTEKFGNKDVDITNGEIEFKNVRYQYKDYEEVNKNEKGKKLKRPYKKLVSTTNVFENLSFKIEKNTTVAFVGQSGSGKSTLLSLMSKMYQVDGGEVLIDGVNINDLSKKSLRNAISLVNQFPYIFDMTIKENLLLAKKDATDEEITNALKDAAIYDFVNSLAKGIDTKLGENGIKLSGGQK